MSSAMYTSASYFGNRGSTDAAAANLIGAGAASAVVAVLAGGPSIIEVLSISGTALIAFNVADIIYPRIDDDKSVGNYPVASRALVAGVVSGAINYAVTGGFGVTLPACVAAGVFIGDYAYGMIIGKKSTAV